jgi:CRISPR-associated endonuclease/helicase Cas3
MPQAPTPFEQCFNALTGNSPFPWQAELSRRFVAGEFPTSCDIPTGLGKTSVMAIWLYALGYAPPSTPRRLVYVVNRRTVVDQATREAEQIRERLPNVRDLSARLQALCADPLDAPLAISTLRGQFADNADWRSDPARPAIVVGTVDMIGSRLLFSGYRCGFKSRPLHAGFLGQDTLLVHDEAHLEPAFQKLIEAIRDEQKREPAPLGEGMRLKLLALTATPRGTEKPFGLERADYKHPEVKKRIEAKKKLRFRPLDDEKKLADAVADLALKYHDSKSSVLVFVRNVEDVQKTVRKLPKGATQQLTGTLRGYERDKLVRTDPIFRRFLPNALGGDEAVYLVCTSAGEVGVNISADHLVCDLSTFESMAQRFGRVNRFGERRNTEIHVVHPRDFDEQDPYEATRRKTLELLQQLKRDGSPRALSRLGSADRLAAFSPPPVFLLTSDILFDAWALTTVPGRLPGRPPVEPYLHGVSDQKPETYVAWRDEVRTIAGELLERYSPEELLEDYPLKPHELLRDSSDRVFEHLAAIAKRNPHDPVWLLDGGGTVEILALNELMDKQRKDRINYRTVLLSPTVGGLQDGLLDGESQAANDVADEWRDEKDEQRRVRLWDNDELPAGMRLVRTIDTKPNADDDDEIEGAVSPKRFWRWYVKPHSADDDGSKTSRGAVTWEVHTKDATECAERIFNSLPLSKGLRKAVILSAKFHDLGKRRLLFQRMLGNTDPGKPLLAKSARRATELTDYRHEFGSLLDVTDEPEFQELSADTRDLVLHLIAAHHGRARPHFTDDEAFDPEPNGKDTATIAAEVPRRFARLQRKFGRWGLAYLESLLRAADYAASATPSATVEEA